MVWMLCARGCSARAHGELGAPLALGACHLLQHRGAASRRAGRGLGMARMAMFGHVFTKKGEENVDLT